MKNIIQKIGNAISFLIKGILIIVPLITGFVFFDDWYSRRTRIDLLPLNIKLSESNILSKYFNLKDEEYNIIYKANTIDNDNYILSPSIMLKSMTSNLPDIMDSYNIYAIDYGLKIIEIKQKQDSITANFSISDSLKIVCEKRRYYINELKKMRGKYYKENEGEIFILLDVLVVNKSEAKTSIIPPSILRIEFEGKEKEFKLNILKQDMSMKIMGEEFFEFSPQSIIDGYANSILSLALPSAKELGADWSFVKEALEKPSAQAVILCYTSNGSIVKSEKFYFSQNYADQEINKRYKLLTKQ